VAVVPSGGDAALDQRGHRLRDGVLGAHGQVSPREVVEHGHAGQGVGDEQGAGAAVDAGCGDGEGACGGDVVVLEPQRAPAFAVEGRSADGGPQAGDGAGERAVLDDDLTPQDDAPADPGRAFALEL